MEEAGSDRRRFSEPGRQMTDMRRTQGSRPAEKSETWTERAYIQLRKDILSGHLKPGARLKIEQLKGLAGPTDTDDGSLHPVGGRRMPGRRFERDKSASNAPDILLSKRMKMEIENFKVALGPMRSVLLANVVCLTVAVPAIGAPASNQRFAVNVEGRDISGVWLINEYVGSARPTEEKIIKTVEGEYPPLQPWSDKIYKDRQDADRKGVPFAATDAYCLPSGMPQMMISAPYPIQVLQTPGQVTMLFELGHLHRQIFINAEQPKDPDPTYMGHSTGKWRGDTLIVDTIGRNTKTTIDMLGMPHSDKLHLIERLRLVNPNLLADVITVDDPGAYTKQWAMRRTYTRQPKGEYPGEYICLDGQRNTPDANGQATFPKFGPPK
jgi:hypothetical protein